MPINDINAYFLALFMAKLHVTKNAKKFDINAKNEKTREKLIMSGPKYAPTSNEQ